MVIYLLSLVLEIIFHGYRTRSDLEQFTPQDYRIDLMILL